MCVFGWMWGFPFHYHLGPKMICLILFLEILQCRACGDDLRLNYCVSAMIRRWRQRLRRRWSRARGTGSPCCWPT